MHRLYKTLAILLTITLLAACDNSDDFTAPSFIHVDGITLEASTATGIGHGDPGFYTSDIVAAYVVAHRKEINHVDTLGLFHMPFTIPVLFDGELDYLELYPAVEQSGVSAALPFYTYYDRIRINNVTLHSGDTLDLDTLSTTYNSQTDIPMLYEPFEPTEASVVTDTTVEWVRHDRDGACIGEGYGRVKVSADQSNVPFAIEHEFQLYDRTKLCYIELDIKSTVTVGVYMKAAYTEGGNPDTKGVMSIHPQEEWQHMYINLGRTWSYFNHPTKFWLSFAALNVDGVEGEVLIDNIKVLSTNVVL